MRRALLVSVPLLLLAFSSSASGATITLTCTLASQDEPPQQIILEIGDGHVRYGSDAGSLVDVQSLEKHSLVVKSDVIAFRQNHAATRVVWDWRIDRASGALTQKYISTESGKSFRTKTGKCDGG